MRYFLFLLFSCILWIGTYSRNNNNDDLEAFIGFTELQRDKIRNNDSIRNLVFTSDCIPYVTIENQLLTSFLSDSISAMFIRNNGNPDTDRIYLYLSPFHEGKEDVWINLKLEHHCSDEVKDIGGNIKRYATIVDGVRYLLFCDSDFDFIKPIPGKEVCYRCLREDLSAEEKEYAYAFMFWGMHDAFFDWTIVLSANNIHTVSKSIFDSWYGSAAQ